MSQVTSLEEFEKVIALPDQEDKVGLDLAIKALVARYGFPVFKGKKLNEPFWASFYAERQKELLFEADEREFYSYDDQSGIYVPRSVDSIRKGLAELLLDASRKWPNMEALAEMRGERDLHGVVAHLRGVTERVNAFGVSGMTIHLENCVIRFNEGGKFTVENFSPKFCSRNRCPIRYDQHAVCPQFYKALLLGADVRGKFLSERGGHRLKALVGGDTLEAERKGSNRQFSIRGIFNVLITSNSRLRVQLEGDQSAWRRRLAIVRYERPYNSKTIPDIHDLLLKTEGSGILNFYLKGVEKLLHDIQQTGNILLSKRQRERVDTLLSESDSLRIFLRENLVSARKHDLTGDEIITDYNCYAIEAGWIPTPRTVAQRQLEDLMLELFSSVKVNNIKRDGKNQRGFRNVRFRQENEKDRQ